MCKFCVYISDNNKTGFKLLLLWNIFSEPNVHMTKTEVQNWVLIRDACIARCRLAFASSSMISRSMCDNALVLESSWCCEVNAKLYGVVFPCRFAILFELSTFRECHSQIELAKVTIHCILTIATIAWPRACHTHLQIYNFIKRCDARASIVQLYIMVSRARAKFVWGARVSSIKLWNISIYWL